MLLDQFPAAESAYARGLVNNHAWPSVLPTVTNDNIFAGWHSGGSSARARR